MNRIDEEFDLDFTQEELLDSEITIDFDDLGIDLPYDFTDSILKVEYDEDIVEKEILWEVASQRTTVDENKLQAFRKDENKPKRGIKRSELLAMLIAVVAIWVIFSPTEEAVIPEVTAEMYVPTLSDHQGNEVEKKIEEAVKEVNPVKKQRDQKIVRPKKLESKKTPKSNVVNVNGMAMVQAGVPVKAMKSAKIGSMTTDERMEKNIVRLQKNLQYCHTRALKKDPNVTGKWQVSFTISTDASIKGLQTKALRKSNQVIEECMTTRIKKFKFSQPDSAYPVDFSILFG